jgi:ribosomal protein S27E
MNTQKWFYSKDGKKKEGPFSSAQLQAMARSGQLSKTDMVLKGGEKNWENAGKIRGLFPPLVSDPSAQTEQQDNITNIRPVPPSETQPGTLPVRCPGCGNIFSLFRIPGINATCPTCGKNLQFPESAPREHLLEPAGLNQSFVRTQPRKRALKILLLTVLLLIIPASVALALWFFLSNRSAFESYRTMVPEDATSVFQIDLSALRNKPAIADELNALDKALQNEVDDLRIEPRSAQLVSLFACSTKTGEQLIALTFDRPIQFSDGARGRYRMVAEILEHRFPPKTSWAIDGEGRLIGGPLELVTAAIDRVKSNQKTAAYDKLTKWAKDIPSGSLGWGIMDFQKELDNFPGGGNPFNKVRINALSFTIAYDENKSKDEPFFKGKAFFASHSDAVAFEEALAELSKGLPKDFQKMVEKRELETKETEATVKLPINVLLLRDVLQSEIQKIKGNREQAWKEAKRQFDAKLKEGDAQILKAKETQRDYRPAAEVFRKAVISFSEATELYPEDLDAKERVQSAKKELGEEEKFLKADEDAKDAHGAAKGAYDEAKGAYELSKKPFNQEALEKGLKKAVDNLGDAKTLRPADVRVKDLQGKIEELKEKHEVLFEEKAFDDQLGLADKALREPDLEKALGCLNKSLEFKKGVKVRPAEAADVGKIVSDLNQIRETRRNLVAAQNAIKEKKFDGAEREAGGLAPFLTKRLPLADKRLKPVLRQMAKDTCAVYHGVMNNRRQVAKNLETEGIDCWNRADFSASKTNFTEGINKLAQAEKLLPKIKAISDESLENIQKQMNDKKMEFEDFNRKGEGLAAVKEWLKQGEEQLGKGNELLAHRRNAAELRQAKAAFEEAEKTFGKAKMHDVKQKLIELQKKWGWPDPLEQSRKWKWSDPADQSGVAQKKGQIAALAICPFELDMRKSNEFPTGWDLADDWKVKGGNWIQAKDKKAYLSPSGSTATVLKEYFPLDFDLEMEVGVVDRNGQLFKYNPAFQFWSKSWLKISLAGKGDRFWMKIGQDPNSRASHDAWIETSANKNFKDVTENPVKIRLQRKDKTATLSIQGRTKQLSFPLVQDFQEISFFTQSENSPSPVIMGASLRIHEPPTK